MLRCALFRACKRKCVVSGAIRARVREIELFLKNRRFVLVAIVLIVDYLALLHLQRSPALGPAEMAPCLKLSLGDQLLDASPNELSRKACFWQ